MAFPARVRRFLRLRRRGVAAILAALATGFALTSLSTSPPPPESPTTAGTSGRVSLAISVRAGADALRAGDRIDLVGAEDDGGSQVLASQAIVVRAATAAGFVGSSSTVLVAVTREDAMKLASRPPDEDLVALILPE